MKRKERSSKKEKERKRVVGWGWVRLSESIKSRGINRKVSIFVRFPLTDKNNGYFGMVEDLSKREKEEEKKHISKIKRM